MFKTVGYKGIIPTISPKKPTKIVIMLASILFGVQPARCLMMARPRLRPPRWWFGTQACPGHWHPQLWSPPGGPSGWKLGLSMAIPRGKHQSFLKGIPKGRPYSTYQNGTVEGKFEISVHILKSLKYTEMSNQSNVQWFSVRGHFSSLKPWKPTDWWMLHLSIISTLQRPTGHPVFGISPIIIT